LQDKEVNAKKNKDRAISGDSYEFRTTVSKIISLLLKKILVNINIDSIYKNCNYLLFLCTFSYKQNLYLKMVILLHTIHYYLSYINST
jgi:hypothetical protein